MPACTVRSTVSRRARLADLGKIHLALRELARVDELARGQEHKLVKEHDNVAERLVDGEDDSPVVIPHQRNVTLHDVVGVVGVETCGIQT